MARKYQPRQGKKNSPAQMTRHHLVPRCRCQVRGGTHTGNIKKVPRVVHEAWHNLFGAMTPFEVLAYIVTVLAERGYFTEAHFAAEWEGANYRFDLSTTKRQDPILAVKRPFRPGDWYSVFGTQTWFSAATQVAQNWAPTGYFTFVNVVASPEEEYSFWIGSETPP